MKTRKNLTESNKDYAVFLPSISGFYNTFISKQQHEEYVPNDRIPAEFENGIERDLLAEYTVNLGRSALSGDSGMFYDGLVYSASLILWHIGKLKTLPSAAERVREVLNSGKALTRLR